MDEESSPGLFEPLGEDDSDASRQPSRALWAVMRAGMSQTM
jgi:hypothetical protein